MGIKAQSDGGISSSVAQSGDNNLQWLITYFTNIWKRGAQSLQSNSKDIKVVSVLIWLVHTVQMYWNVTLNPFNIITLIILYYIITCELKRERNIPVFIRVHSYYEYYGKKGFILEIRTYICVEV
jgi:hypothetical protein